MRVKKCKPSFNTEFGNISLFSISWKIMEIMEKNTNLF